VTSLILPKTAFFAISCLLRHVLPPFIAFYKIALACYYIYAALDHLSQSLKIFGMKDPPFQIHQVRTSSSCLDMKKALINFVAPLIIIISPFFIPLFSVTFDVNTIITVVSLIFAILIGFFIATATTNYLKLQELISNEDSCLISIFNLTEVIQPSAVSKMRDVIDNYSTKTLDFSISKYVGKTQKEFKEVLIQMDNLSPQDEKGIQLLSNLYEKRDDFLKSRQEITLASKIIATPAHWIIITFLSLLIVGLILAMRDGSIIFSVIVSMLSLAIYLILVLLYRIDNNSFLEEQLLAYQNSQIIFSELGLLKYFPYDALKNRSITKPDEDFRVGIYKGVWGESEREIKIIKKGESLN